MALQQAINKEHATKGLAVAGIIRGGSKVFDSVRNADATVVKRICCCCCRRWRVQYADGRMSDVREKNLSCLPESTVEMHACEAISFWRGDTFDSFAVAAQVQYSPEIREKTLMQPWVARHISRVLPGTICFKKWTCIYSPILHGSSLETLYRNFAAQPGASVLLIRDTTGHLFGCFASEAWRKNSERYYGSGECFVFSFGPSGEDGPVGDSNLQHGGKGDRWFYNWTEIDAFFMYADSSMLAMGCGASPALSLDKSLQRGTSAPCPTFGSPLLASAEEFVVQKLEFWGFHD